MEKRIVIPVEDSHGKNSKLAQHFGQAPYFALVELKENGEIANLQIKANTSEHTGGTGSPHGTILDLKPEVIITYAMGPGALETFKNANIKVLKATSGTIKELITSFNAGKLQDSVGACPQAHHHSH